MYTYTTFDIVPGLRKNILNFEYGINYKKNYMEWKKYFQLDLIVGIIGIYQNKELHIMQ